MRDREPSAQLAAVVRASLAGTGELRKQLVGQWMAVRAGPDRIDGPSCGVAPDGGGGDSLEAPGEQAAGERHGEPGRDELSEREDVAGHEGDVRLESGRQAGAINQAVARRRRPGVPGEPLQVDCTSARETVPRGKRRQHRLFEEIAAFERLVVTPWRGGILEYDSEVQRALAHGRDELVQRALGDIDLEVWVGSPHPYEGLRHDRRDRARERPYGQVSALLADQSTELLGGQAQPAGNGIRVPKKERSRRSEAEPAGAPVDQSDPELPLERDDLLGDGGLSERQLLRCAGEGTESGYLAKGEETAWIEY